MCCARLAERGIRVPQDISVAGIDDIPEAAYFGPPLTSVHIDFAEGGRVAARSLISLIENPGAPLPEYPVERSDRQRVHRAAPLTSCSRTRSCGSLPCWTTLPLNPAALPVT